MDDSGKILWFLTLHELSGERAGYDLLDDAKLCGHIAVTKQIAVDENVQRSQIYRTSADRDQRSTETPLRCLCQQLFGEFCGPVRFDLGQDRSGGFGFDHP